MVTTTAAVAARTAAQLDEARARRIAAVLEEPTPSLPARLVDWVASPGRLLVLGIGIAVVAAVFSFGQILDDQLPKKPQIGKPPTREELAAKAAQELLYKNRLDAKANLVGIGNALVVLAKAHKGFPNELSHGLFELSVVGDYTHACDAFEGGKLKSYTRFASPDLHYERAVLEAVVKGTTEVVTTEVRYYPKAGA